MEKNGKNNSVNQIVESYDRFIPHQIYDLLDRKSILDIKLGDQKELKLSILFSDIRDFTSISEALKPKENFDFINSYLSQMDSVIDNYNGIINKFLGDGIMAFFPSNADDAVTSSIQMIEQLKKFNKKYNSAYHAPVRIGIGLNTGLCMLGIVGDSNRMEATIISDAVNIASRLESLTKKYGVDILISENTVNSIQDVSLYLIRLIDRVQVKGKNQPISIFEVYDNDEPKMRALKNQTKLLFEEAIANYHYKKVDIATVLFEKCVAINPDDKPARFYLNRCIEFAKSGYHEGTIELSRKIEWSDDLKIGHSIVDNQHYELFVNSKKLLSAIERGISNAEIEEITSFINKYVVEHFETEEKYLLEVNYPFYEHQKGQHNNFIKSFKLLKNEISSGAKSKTFLMFKIQTLLIDWFTYHTIKEDKHFVKYIRGREELSAGN
jgi:hemerythrin